MTTIKTSLSTVNIKRILIIQFGYFCLAYSSFTNLGRLLNGTTLKINQLKTSNIDKTWSSVSNSSFILVLDYKFWLVLVEGNKVNSLSLLKNAIKLQDLLFNGKFHLFLALP